ncbi:MAG: penicillin acylase family protein [bacterium]|nr:penicillin acylase family protein [bacterium]
MRKIRLSIGLSLLVWAVGAAPSAAVSEKELLEQAEAYAFMPERDDLPLPQSGWYTLTLSGDHIEVYRDSFGVPHVFAPSIEAAFRAQGYVIMEDRCIQIIRTSDSVMGRRAILDANARRSDERMRTSTYPEQELLEMLEGLAPEILSYMQAYLDGANAYMAKYVPERPPFRMVEVAAGAAHYMNVVGDVGGGNSMDIRKLMGILKVLRGERFKQAMLHDALPSNVPTAPTTDHSEKRVAPGTVLAAEDPVIAEFDPDSVIAALDRRFEANDYAREQEVLTKWGSQVWAVSPERSTTGNAMLFLSPMMGFSSPAKGAQVHLVAPGLNVSGICFIGVPGVVLGHNDRVAWGSTSAMVCQTDFYVEKLNPDNEHQYWHNGEWKDMEAIDWPIVVRQEDDTLAVEPYTVYRTVHGPIVEWETMNNRAYAKCRSYDRLQVQSFAAHLEMNFARNVEDMGRIVRDVATSHNYVCADGDGNIAYYLAGRLPQRRKGHDPRLPVPGTGEYDWLGVKVATDVVSTVNPAEGWLQNFNNKPSTKIKGWWPEILWGHPIAATLEETAPIDWDTFVDINRRNGEHHFGGPFMGPYLVRLLKERGGDDPQTRMALELLENWDYRDVPGAAAVTIFNEWFMECMVEVLSADFGPLVERSMSLGNVQIFGPLFFRIMEPDRSGIELIGDYLHGRDKDAVALDCFNRIMADLSEKYGADCRFWPRQPDNMRLDDVRGFPKRNCGTYWMAVEFGKTIQARDLLVPGQCEDPKSPNYQDQYAMFMDWQMKDAPFRREDLPLAPVTGGAVASE